ncbi:MULTISPECIES: arsenate reductase ArsC [unclassified Caproiciproducens]|uniref:arsenate reductase ArsC n=1 Tax=Caproiciproducens sp. R1 TaxID=3435000 RepID=UPI004034A2B5
MLKVLFLCTGNSARSQIAEAILNSKGKDRIIAYSAGSEPEKEINPYAIKVLKEIGIDISDCKPKSLKLFSDQYFDFVITLCDRARNQCPVIAGPSIHVHWGFPDPKYFEGTDEEILKQFRTLVNELTRRIDLFMLLPLEKSDRTTLKKKLNEIVETN